MIMALRGDSTIDLLRSKKYMRMLEFEFNLVCRIFFYDTEKLESIAGFFGVTC